ncbi:threonine aldolase [Microbispora amethystogenes]|nr:threonine aldolase [Microbispora amethystogenes]
MRRHDENDRGFASDNCAGVPPEVIAAVVEANGGHQRAYGKDVYTAHLIEVMRTHFGEQAEVFPVFNGTGANVTALTGMLPRWGAVIAADSAHLHNSESGAPERVGGFKLLTVDAPGGKLTVEAIDREAWGWGNEHRAQPLAVSIAQSTELGTLYSVEEIREIADHAHAKGMTVHMDGARVSNAAAALGVPLRDFTTDAGVDVLSFGGTKNGMLFGEAVVVLRPGAVSGLAHLRKQHMQLASKMRFVSAQFIALLDGDLHLRLAGRANEMAARLRAALEERLAAGEMSGLRFSQPTQTNAVFAVLPREAAERIRKRVRFYDSGRLPGEARWMTAFDTTEADVDAFVEVIREELAG